MSTKSVYSWGRAILTESHLRRRLLKEKENPGFHTENRALNMFTACFTCLQLVGQGLMFQIDEWDHDSFIQRKAKIDMLFDEIFQEKQNTRVLFGMVVRLLEELAGYKIILRPCSDCGGRLELISLAYYPMQKEMIADGFGWYAVNGPCIMAPIWKAGYLERIRQDELREKDYHNQKHFNDHVREYAAIEAITSLAVYKPPTKDVPESVHNETVTDDTTDNRTSKRFCVDENNIKEIRT